MLAAKEAAPKLVELSKKHEVILVHGNGPQVGILALMEQSYSAQTGTTPYTFDCLGCAAAFFFFAAAASLLSRRR